MKSREHGGGLQAAISAFGGAPTHWLDLSTGINPNPYPVSPEALGQITGRLGALPDTDLTHALEVAARSFWDIPKTAAVVPAGGASAIIAALPSVLFPRILKGQTYALRAPIYNEYETAFNAHGWARAKTAAEAADVAVHVNPNNPDGAYVATEALEAGRVHIVDESFCDLTPQRSLIAAAARPDTIIIKSFGKFWGLAGLRLGFAICAPELASALSNRLGPWPVSAPALITGAAALNDPAWAQKTRNALAQMRARLDEVLLGAGFDVIGGCDLFRLAAHPDAAARHETLCRAHILTRPFSYAPQWLRFGLPKDETDLRRLAQALGL